MIQAVEFTAKTDPATASLLLHAKIATLIELYFDLIQRWLPAPKQQLRTIREIDPKLGNLLDSFYVSGNLVDQIAIAKETVNRVFEKNA